MHSEQDARIAGLIDERRKVAARLADLDMQIAKAVGDREGMRRAQREMYAQVEARKAAKAKEKDAAQ